MAPFKVHSIRFYQPDPKPIQCMVLNEQKDTLALGRSDASLEIWSVSHNPYLQKTIPPSPEGSIEGLSWFDGRLFSCGLHGFVLEHDLDKLVTKSQQAVTSGPAWCMASNKPTKTIAVGTEEGFVNLFSILSDSLEYLRILDKQEGRILCINWHPLGTHIVTGSVDTIRVWEYTSGHPTARMTTGRVARNIETIVWSVVVTDDMTIISGDSRGRTSFWNGTNGTLIESIHSHKADVLTVELNSNGTTAYSAGVDPTIMHFQLITKNDGRRKWVRSLHRCINTHDVRSLVSNKDKIFSGGVDSYLTVANYVAKSVTRVPQAPRGGVIEVAGPAGVCLLKYSKHVEVWRLGDTDHNTGMVGCNLPLSREPTRILELHTKDEEYLVCSTISKDAGCVAYATQTRFRVFRLYGCAEGDSNPPSLKRIKFTDKETELPHQMAFYKNKDDETCLIVGSQAGNLQVYSVSDTTMYICWSLLSSELHISSSIHLLAVAGRNAVVADFTGNIVALDLDKETVVSKLPSYKESCLTAMTLSPNGKMCLMVYSNQRLMEVDIRTARFTNFSNGFNQKLHREWTNRKLPITGACYITPDLILLHDDEYLAVIDKDKEIQEPETKLHITDPMLHPDESQDGSYISSSPSSSSMKQDAVSFNCLRLVKKFYHLTGVHHLADNSIVCLEMKPNQIEEKLPPSLKMKKFGAH